jgi:S1-C subfamily serine protease
VTLLDWLAVLIVLLVAFNGLRKGLIAGILSLAGVVVGAILGARLAPEFLSGGSHSPYTPLVALAGAAFLAIFFEGLGTMGGSMVREGLRLPALRKIDSAGGLLLGAATGLAIVWVLGAVALLFPGQTSLRQRVQQSLILGELNGLVPPSQLLHALARVDPFPAIAGPLAPVAPPNPKVLRQPGVRKAEPSVVKLLGTSCGLGVEGSGWVARPGLVVTAAHVVAGQSATTVETVSGGRYTGRAVAFDSRNDIAVLRVPGLRARPLPSVDPRPGESVAILGFPGNGPFSASPGRIGRTTALLTRDAYGRGPVLRTITSLRGLVRHGDSGGPAVDSRGRVQTTIFGARVGSSGGYGVPTSLVRRALASARGTVSTGPCAR